MSIFDTQRGPGDTPIYNKKLPTNYGDLISRDEFITDVNAGCFSDYDGFGNPVKNGLMDEDYTIWPTQIEQLPTDCTHIMWYNK